ncbi:MAG: lipid A deacylase LpxR family protein [Bacteroidales bacterium]
MRAFLIILVSLVFFTRCGKQQVSMPVLPKKTAPTEINFAAGVMISPQKKLAKSSGSNLDFAEKILSPHRIPVLDTVGNQMVFVKLNGDRVSVTLDKLVGKYDIILFNPNNNPVPLRIADLQGAFDQIFSTHSEIKSKPKKKSYIREIAKSDSDTVVHKTFSELLLQLKNRDKKIIVTTADTSSSKLVLRNIPGIEWVEQKIDTRRILKISFENDLITYANTDRYFTNGIAFDLQAAWLSRSPLSKLMLRYNHKANVTYNLSMVQDMFTPTDTRVAPTLQNDRPYSSYLYFGFSKTTADPRRKIKIISKLDVGYIGPHSPGSYMQTLVHQTFPSNDVPLGWETQINTDIILNYAVQAQKAVFSKQKITVLANIGAKAGTLNTSTSAGLQLLAGKYEPVFGLLENEKWPKTEYYFFAKTNISFVAYNALLQGGMFNHDNIFVLCGNQIQRFVGSAEAGFHLRYKGFGIEMAQHYLSPEYKSGLWHKWGRISLLFKI